MDKYNSVHARTLQLCSFLGASLMGNKILMFLLLKGVSVSVSILCSYVAVRADYLARASLRTQFHNDECSLHRRHELVSGGGEVKFDGYDECRQASCRNCYNVLLL